MGQLRPHEEWARQVLTRALGREVRQHDDGTRPGMYDLIVLDDVGTAVGAVEVTTATDTRSAQYWRLVQDAQPWRDERVMGTWAVTTVPSSQVKALRGRLPVLLRNLALKNVFDYWHEPDGDPFAEELGVLHAARISETGEGRIFLMPPQDRPLMGFVVPDTADELLSWTERWLLEPKREDNLRKLSSTGLHDRHLFVIFPPLTAAPEDAVVVLMPGQGESPPLPTRPPSLPSDISHLWLASGWAVSHGLRWCRSGGWSLFSSDLREAAA